MVELLLNHKADINIRVCFKEFLSSNRNNTKIHGVHVSDAVFVCTVTAAWLYASREVGL